MVSLQGVRNKLMLVTGTLLLGIAQAQALVTDAVANSDSSSPSPSIYLWMAKWVGRAQAFMVGVTLPWKAWQHPLWGDN